MRNKGRWLAVLALVAIASLFGGCATGGRPAITGLRAAFVTYVIPKDPRLTNLRGRAAARLSLPAYEVSDTQETVTGLSNTFWPDGALVVDRFTAARSKGRRSGVEYRIQQETIEQADRYLITLRPESVRTYGGLFLIDPPQPVFSLTDLLRHLGSAHFTYAMDLDSPHPPATLAARIVRQAEGASMVSDEIRRGIVGRCRRVSLLHEGVPISISFEAIPSGTGSRATFRLTVPSYFTAPHTVDLAQILASLRERLEQLTRHEPEPFRQVEKSEGRQEKAPMAGANDVE